MPLKPGTSKKTVQENTKKEIQAGKSPEQAYAIAKNKQRQSKKSK